MCVCIYTNPLLLAAVYYTLIFDAYAGLIRFTRHEYGIRYEWQNFN